MISIALLIVLILLIVALFTYAMVALIKKDIFVKDINISKKNGINLSFSAKEKNEVPPTRRELRSE